MLYDKLTQEELDWNGTWSGFPTSPELRQWQDESSAKRVALVKQRLIDIGYMDAAGNVLKPGIEPPRQTYQVDMNGSMSGANLTLRNSIVGKTKQLEKLKLDRDMSGASPDTIEPDSVVY